MTLETGMPGWVGTGVRLMRLDAQGNPTLFATVSLCKETQTLLCDHEELMSEWEREGILGRASEGTVFPSEARRFLDELPFMYKSAYFFAEPLHPADESNAHS